MDTIIVTGAAGFIGSALSRYLRSRRMARVIGIGREVAGRRQDGSTFPMELAITEIARGGGAVDVSKTAQSSKVESPNTQTATAAPASPAEARR